jgi:hypothetical protein
VNHRFGSFSVDCQGIDKLAEGEDSYAFSSIRELYIRDCYFRFHDFAKDEIRTVADLGANRGMFSLLAATFCEKLLMVEAQEKYNACIKLNMQSVNFTNYLLSNAFIGAKTPLNTMLQDISHVSLETLMETAEVEHIDFLKIDIEGSEFSIFETLPLNRVRYLSMEVHRDVGDANLLRRILDERGFSYTCSDARFVETTDPSKIDYIYAKNVQFGRSS